MVVLLMLRQPAALRGSKFFKYWIDFQTQNFNKISSIIAKMAQEARQSKLFFSALNFLRKINT
jgi:hypothetical protein